MNILSDPDRRGDVPKICPAGSASRADGRIALQRTSFSRKLPMSPAIQTSIRAGLGFVATLVVATSCGDSDVPGPDGAAPTESAGTNSADTVVDIWTPAAIGDVATLAARLDRAGDIDARDPTFETTALAFATDFGQADAVTLLLEAGADPDARNGNGSTPTIGAAFFGRPECLRLLLEAGADPALADENGTTTFTALDVPWEITKGIADLFEMPLEPTSLEAGRDACRRLLEAG